VRRILHACNRRVAQQSLKCRVWVSGRFWFEGKSGLAEESGDEIGLPLDAVQLVPEACRLARSAENMII
jgi:hypothetical protein